VIRTDYDELNCPLTVTETDTLTKANYITATAPEVVETTVITYTYDALYRLTGAYYSTGEVFEYTYDAVGNRVAMTTTTGVTTYTYDAANRLLVSSSPGHLVTYTWDGANRLVQVVSG